MSTSHRRPASKHRVTASTLLATAAAAIGIGLAAAAPASADTGNVLNFPKPPSISHYGPTAPPSVKIDPKKVAAIKAAVRRVLSSLPKPCAEQSNPDPAA